MRGGGGEWCRAGVLENAASTKDDPTNRRIVIMVLTDEAYKKMLEE